MIRQIQPGLWQVRSVLVSHYVLVEGERATVIDGGFVTGLRGTEAALRAAGLDWRNLSAILLTHGHLDHSLHASEMAARSGAPILCHAADADHASGAHRYRGLSRVCGWLESAGRPLLGFRPPPIARFFEDGERLDVWGGLQVVHLPGHTAGHCGFLSLERGLFFAGDLFANTFVRCMVPWPWLNSCPELLPSSFAKAAAMPMRGILCNHCDRAAPETQLRRFRGFKPF